MQLHRPTLNQLTLFILWTPYACGMFQFPVNPPLASPPKTIFSNPVVKVALSVGINLAAQGALSAYGSFCGSAGGDLYGYTKMKFKHVLNIDPLKFEKVSNNFASAGATHKDILLWIDQATHRKDYEEGGFFSPGLLLCGPSGLGKTHTMRSIINKVGGVYTELDPVYFDIGPSSQGSTSIALDNVEFYANKATKGLGGGFFSFFKSFFKKDHQKVFICFDEFGLSREGNAFANRDDQKKATNTLLQKLDGMHRKNEYIYYLAATNRPQDVDKALVRPGRLKKIYMRLPGRRSRFSIAKYWLNNAFNATGKILSEKDIKKISYLFVDPICFGLAAIDISCIIGEVVNERIATTKGIFSPRVSKHKIDFSMLKSFMQTPQQTNYEVEIEEAVEQEDKIEASIKNKIAARARSKFIDTAQAQTIDPDDFICDSDEEQNHVWPEDEDYRDLKNVTSWSKDVKLNEEYKKLINFKLGKLRSNATSSEKDDDGDDESEGSNPKRRKIKKRRSSKILLAMVKKKLCRQQKQINELEKLLQENSKIKGKEKEEGD